MNSLHDIQATVRLADRQKAQVAYAVARGRRVRIRTTPITRKTQVETYHTYSTWYGTNSTWANATHPPTNQARYIAAHHHGMAPFVVGRK